MTAREAIDKLNRGKKLTEREWTELLHNFTDRDMAYAAELARTIALRKFGNKIFFRGIIEFTNICKNDCLYCGIRRSNTNLERYRLTKEDILACCREGYALGFRTFVLQGGEDGAMTDERLTDLVSAIHEEYPDCAITLSVGERSRESYEKLYAAGATRFLLRHKTATEERYKKLHPDQMSWQNRMRCLRDLKEIGFQTGCGCMVGAPYQTTADLARDMVFMGEFKPHMIGMGPFIPHKDTPFRDFPAGSVKMTLFLLSLARIMLPDVLLPATTALGTMEGDGRQKGVLAGANVIMPNLSPLSVRKKYMLYDNKAGTEDDAASGMEKLKKQMSEIGYEIVVTRGDYRGEQ